MGDHKGVIFYSTHEFVKIVLKALNDYEEVPNRRRMITDGMMQWLITQASYAGLDSSTQSIVDWILLGRYTGFRASEWCQKTLNTYARIDWLGQPSLAFTRLDFQFL